VLGVKTCPKRANRQLDPHWGKFLSPQHRNQVWRGPSKPGRTGEGGTKKEVVLGKLRAKKIPTGTQGGEKREKRGPGGGTSTELKTALRKERGPLKRKNTKKKKLGPRRVETNQSLKKFKGIPYPEPLGKGEVGQKPKTGGKTEGA